MRAITIIAACSIAWASLASSASAQTSPKADLAKARAHHKRGSELFEAGDHAGAIVEFEAAYELSKAPGVLFNLAAALLEAQRCREAAQRFEQFAKEDPRSPLHNEAIDLSVKARECQREQERRAAAEAAAKAERQESTAATPPTPVRDPGGMSNLRWVGIGVAVSGLAMAGTGVVFGIKANSDSDELSARFADGGTWDNEDDELQSRYERNKTLAYVFAGVGTAAALAGAGIFVWDLMRGGDAGEAPVTARITSTEQVLLWSVRFE